MTLAMLFAFTIMQYYLGSGFSEGFDNHKDLDFAAEVKNLFTYIPTHMLG